MGLVALAIVLDALAYRRLPGQARGVSTKGLALSVCCGLLMGSFYWLVSRSMAIHMDHPEPGRLTPYSAVFFFPLGVLASNLVLNTLIMIRPFRGTPVSWSDYARGTAAQHLLGLLGGTIWCIGMTCNVIASPVASAAVSYGLGQGATMIAAAGVFVWGEFRTAKAGTGTLLAAMFGGVSAGADAHYLDETTVTPRCRRSSRWLRVGRGLRSWALGLRCCCQDLRPKT